MTAHGRSPGAGRNSCHTPENVDAGADRDSEAAATRARSVAPGPERVPSVTAPTASVAAAESARSARPTATMVSPTATTCAKYHVVPSIDVYQNTVPSPKNNVAAALSRSPSPSPPSSHQASQTSSPPISAARSWASVVRPHNATNGTRTSAGRGGNGIIALPVDCPSASTTGRTSRKKSLYG